MDLLLGGAKGSLPKGMCAQTTAGLGFIGEDAQVLDREDIFTCSFASH